MQPLQDPSALPYSPHAVNTQFFIQGLPNTVPFTPNIPVPPAIAPYYQMVVGQALLVAQGHADRTVQRRFFFNALSSNAYNNQLFIDLVQATVELTDFLMGTRRYDVMSAAKEAAETMNAVMSSDLTRRYPALRGYMTAEQVMGADAWIQKFSTMVQEIQAWRTQATQRQAGMGGWQPQPTQSTPAAMGHPSAAAHRSNSMWRSEPQGTGACNSSGVFGGWLGAVSDKTNNDAVETALDAIMAPDQPNFNQGNPPMIQTTQPQPEATPVMTTDRPWDRMDLDGGVVVVPASLSRRSVTKNESNPYTMAYHPSETCLFHGLRSDGVVEEVFLPWVRGGDTMDYLKHELRSDIRTALPKDPNGDIEVPLYTQIARMEPITDTMLALVDGDESTDGDLPEEIRTSLPVRVSFASSLEDMIEAALIETSVVHDELAETESEVLAFCTEQYGDVVSTHTVDVVSMAWFMTLAPITRIDELLSAMKDARESDEVDKALLDLIAVRLTDEVNKALAYNLQVDLKITNIEEDYKEVCEIFTSVYGEMIVNAWNAHQGKLVGKALNVLFGERLSEYLNLRYDEAVAQKLVSKVLVFSDRIAVTFTGWESIELDIAFVGSGAISETTMPNLHKAAVAMFDRTALSEYPFSNHFMRTKDGTLLEFHKGWLGEGFYLISKF